MKKQIVSANLNELAVVIYQKLNQIKEKGWFSRFISEKLIDEYHKDFEKKILTELLNKKTKERNQMEKEIKQIVKKLKKVKP